MDGDIEEVVINPCPVCETEGGHTFVVPAQRSWAFGSLLGNVNLIGIKFCRVTFRCPATGNQFAATLRMKVESDEGVSSVGKPRPVSEREVG